MIPIRTIDDPPVHRSRLHPIRPTRSRGESRGAPPPPPLPAIFIYRLARNDRSFPHGGNFVYTKEYRGLDGRTRFQNRFSSAVASMQRDGDVDDDADTTTRFFFFSLSFSRRYFSRYEKRASTSAVFNLRGATKGVGFSLPRETLPRPNFFLTRETEKRW